MTKTVGRRKGSSRDRHPDFNFNVKDAVKKNRKHILLGYVPGTLRVIKGEAVPIGIMIHQFVGWDNHSKWTGTEIREMRKKNGVGRRKTKSE